MHLLLSGKCLAVVTNASVHMFCQISEEYKVAFEASCGDMKTLQRKLKSGGGGGFELESLNIKLSGGMYQFQM